MKKVLVFILGMGLLAGCTQTQVTTVANTAGCTLEAGVAASVSAVIVSQLSCTNVAVVQNDVLGIVQKSNICKQPAVSAAVKSAVATPSPTPDAVATLICPGLTADAVAAATSQIKPTWGCTGGVVAADLSALILTACNSKF